MGDSWENAKNNKTNPFPRKAMRTMIIQGISVARRSQNGGQSPWFLLSYAMNHDNHPQGYYSETLAAERLKKCYEIAPPKVQAYLQGEIDFVRSRVSPDDTILELGCGYGRVLREIAPHVRRIYGIDTSLPSLHLVRRYADGWPIIHDGSGFRPTINGGPPTCYLAAMDAINLAFPDKTFDLVFCIQNGISAFHVDQVKLIAEALRVTRKGGRVLFSSYAQAFWDDRLDWFRLQAAHGLIGEIDEAATGTGVIVCKDGFTATTITPDDFHRLISSLGLAAEIIELPSGALFCELEVN
jgi:2-polyprenyl-6-hydroxyphenyl methylase/3-demethylubiquinone-9 3-methyltransferase